MNVILPPARNLDQNPWFWAGFLFLWLMMVSLLMGFDGLYGQDAYAHLNYARDIQNLWRTGTPLGTYQWPRLYAFLGALWLWGDPRGWMQVLSMAGAALTLAMMIKLLHRIVPEGRWLPALTFAFVGLSPILVRNSLSVMADAPSLGLMTAALWLGVSYADHGKRWQLLSAAALAGGAILLRYPVALVMFLPAMSWLWKAFRRKEWLGLMLFLPAMLLSALPQLLLPQAVGEGLSQPFQHQHFLQWTPINYFGRSFVQQDGYNTYPVFNLAAALGLFWHPRFLGLGFLGILGIFWQKKWGLPRWSWLAMGAIGINVLFLAGIPFQNPRFMLPALPFAAILLGASWNAGWERILGLTWMRRLVFALLLMVQIGLGWWSCKLFFKINAMEIEIATDLSALPNRGQRLYELSFEAMLRARNVPLKEVSMWVGPLPEPRKGDLVLFNLSAFEQQFAGMWPMKNWAMLHDSHELTKQKEWKEGWALYEIQ